MIPVWLQAGLWGLFSGGALLIGAAVGYRVELSNRRIAGIMAFGAGVLISALTFELMEEAVKEGGLRATIMGFAVGAVVYSAANWALSFYGAKHRKRSKVQHASKSLVNAFAQIPSTSVGVASPDARIEIGL